MKYLIVIVCILAGCSTKPTSSSTTETTNDSVKDVRIDPIVIDMTKTPKKVLILEDIANIEYIPLETNDSTLVNRPRPNVVSDHYIIYQNDNGQIHVFNRKGKSLYSFNRSGGGPEEYFKIYDIVLDEKKEELFVEDIHKEKIFVYSIDGKFKRELALPRKFFPECLMNYDKDYLFCYNVYFLDHADESNQEDCRKRDNPYFFISKQTGEITPLNYCIPNRTGNKAKEMKNGKRTAILSIGIFPLSQNTPDIMITEHVDDTIYSLKEGKLTPIMIKNPSTHKMDPPMLVGVDFFTDRYISFLACKMKFEERISSINMIYDKQSDEFYRLATRLPISFPMKGGKINLPKNTALCRITPERLLKDYNDGKLEGELKEIASKLKEDDNPVLMLIKFKE